MTLQITVNGKTRDMTEGEVAELAASQPPLDAIRAIAILAIKTEAQRRILAIAPAYRQANLTARAAEISLFEEKPYSAEIEAELTAGRAVWAAIKAVRDASDAAEALVAAAATEDEIRAVTPSWPG